MWRSLGKQVETTCFPRRQPTSPTPPTIPEGNSALPEVLGIFSSTGAQFPASSQNHVISVFRVARAQKHGFRGPSTRWSRRDPFFATFSWVAPKPRISVFHVARAQKHGFRGPGTRWSRPYPFFATFSRVAPKPRNLSFSRCQGPKTWFSGSWHTLESPRPVFRDFCLGRPETTYLSFSRC